MYKFLERYTFIWSFIFGAFLAILVVRNQNKVSVAKRENFEDKYEVWFEKNGYTREILTMDEVKFGNGDKKLESEFLYDTVNVLCVVLVRKRKNAVAANLTWATHCNDRRFIYLKPEHVQKTMLPIKREKIESSWHLLCDAIRKIPSNHQWVLFVNDDTFAIPENVRLMVASLNSDQGHYLGHPISFWGTDYNVGQAGYVLSRGSIKALQNQFNSTETCKAGGRFWKQEDYYLGKHLSDLGIRPSDTRDSSDLSTFHGYNLAQMLFPGSLRELSNYYKHALYPVRCCSPLSVTFQSVEADKMHTARYLVYGVGLFGAGGKGNRPPETPGAEREVWRGFLREQGVWEEEVSPERYYELWKGVVNDPEHFNQDLRKWMNSSN